MTRMHERKHEHTKLQDACARPRNGCGSAESRERHRHVRAAIWRPENWEWSPQVAALFGARSAGSADAIFAGWERTVFVDDVPKLRAALEAATESGSFYVEFRRQARRRQPALARRQGHTRRADETGRVAARRFYDITERKALEARLLALNETLEARVAELREEARTLEVLNRTGVAVAAELDLERLVQMVTDAGVELSHARVRRVLLQRRPRRRAKPTRSTRSRARRAKRSRNFPMPRNTAIFEPTFRGTRTGALRRYPGRSALRQERAVSRHAARAICRCAAISPCRSCRARGEVLGGLFFGHPQPGMFTERAERIVTALAAQAAVAIDNARLYQTSQREIAARRQAEAKLQELNETLSSARRSARSSSPPASQARRNRAAVPAAGGRRHRLRDLHARSRGARRELESRRRSASRAMRARRSSASIFRSSTPRRTGSAAFRRSALETAARDRKVRGRRLARAQGRHQLLGERRHQRDPGRGRRAARLRQDHARPHRAARRRRARCARRRRWKASASSPAASRTTSTIF